MRKAYKWCEGAKSGSTQVFSIEGSVYKMNLNPLDIGGMFGCSAASMIRATRTS